MASHPIQYRLSSEVKDERDWIAPALITSDDGQHSSHELQSLEQNDCEATTKPSWRSLFAFTTRQHWPPVVFATSSTIIAGLIKPAISIFFGKIFAVITSFGGRNLTGQEALHQVSIWCIGLTALGVGAWLAEGGVMAGWVTFGELQARCARQDLFATMLDKDIEWYDSRKDGTGAFLIRIQT